MHRSERMMTLSRQQAVDTHTNQNGQYCSDELGMMTILWCDWRRPECQSRDLPLSKSPLIDRKTEPPFEVSAQLLLSTLRIWWRRYKLTKLKGSQRVLAALGLIARLSASTSPNKRTEPAVQMPDLLCILPTAERHCRQFVFTREGTALPLVVLSCGADAQ